jgi:hypothetical protein
MHGELTYWYGDDTLKISSLLLIVLVFGREEVSYRLCSHEEERTVYPACQPLILPLD